MWHGQRGVTEDLKQEKKLSTLTVRKMSLPVGEENGWCEGKSEGRFLGRRHGNSIGKNELGLN